MLTVIFTQLVALALAVVLGGMLAGMRGGISSALGGLAVIVPNLLFAWRVRSVARQSGPRFMLGLMSAEIAKLAAVLGLLVLFASEFPGVHWPSLLLGLVFATQALFFAFWKKN